jgi:hypothetical protein
MDDTLPLLAQTDTKLATHIPRFREMVVGKWDWSWSGTGADFTVLDLLDGGTCEVWSQGVMHTDVDNG